MRAGWVGGPCRRAHCTVCGPCRAVYIGVCAVSWGEWTAVLRQGGPEVQSGASGQWYGVRSRTPNQAWEGCSCSLNLPNPGDSKLTPQCPQPQHPLGSGWPVTHRGGMFLGPVVGGIWEVPLFVAKPWGAPNTASAETLPQGLTAQVSTQEPAQGKKGNALGTLPCKGPALGAQTPGLLSPT